MKHYLLMSAAMLCALPLAASPVKDKPKELEQATYAAMQIYRKQGIAGVQKAVNDCYKEVGYATPFCVYLDAAGREIDFTVAKAYKELGQNVLPTPFFQAKAFGSRTASFYILHRHTRKESNEHMQKSQKQIAKIIERQLFAQ